jgi:hypothetical protein
MSLFFSNIKQCFGFLSYSTATFETKPASLQHCQPRIFDERMSMIETGWGTEPIDSCDTAKSKPKVLFVVQASMPGKLKAFVQREGHVMTRVQWEEYDRKELDKLDWSKEALEDYVTR